MVFDVFFIIVDTRYQGGTTSITTLEEQRQQYDI